MKIFKKTLVLIIGICLLFSLTACGEKDELDEFDPVAVRVVEAIGGEQIETVIEDEEIAKKMWNVFQGLSVDVEKRGEMGSAYIYMCFYEEDQSTLGIFTMYENGSCLMGEDFSNFYTVVNGEDIYMELCDIYTDYSPEE